MQFLVTYLPYVLMAGFIIPSAWSYGVPLGLLFVLSAVNDAKRIRFIQLLKTKWIWLLFGPFLLFCIGILYSNDPLSGWKVTETRMMLVFTPLMIFMYQPTIETIEKWLNAFAVIVLTGAAIGFLSQLPKFINQEADASIFFNDNLVVIFKKQAVYYALYVNIALVGLMNSLLKAKIRRIQLVWILLGLGLLVTQYLLACRLAIIITGVILLLSIYLLISKKYGRKWAVIAGLSALGVMSFAVTSVPRIAKRFKSITNLSYQFDNPNGINHFNGEISEKNWNGLNTRVALWTCALEEVKKNPVFGTGIGDVKADLLKNYRDKNFHLALERKYNTHNQYLDVCLSNGIIGLLLFLSFLIVPLWKLFPEQNRLLAWLLVVIILSFITENYISREQGVSLLGFLMGLCYFHLINSQLQQKNT